MNNEPICAETHYIDIRNLNSLIGYTRADKVFSELAGVLQETIRLLPGMENFVLLYRNILEREMNPDGGFVFFRATNHPTSGDHFITFQIVKPPVPTVSTLEDPKLRL